jgi:hypothetical protein
MPPHGSALRRRVLLASLGLAPVAHGVSAAPAGAATTWLCHPSLAADPCRAPLQARAVAADGSATPVRLPAERPRRVDCFYVYPTVSGQPTVNADLSRDEPVIAAATNDVSRFSPTCRVFAPVYRQITLSGLFRGRSRPALETAYADVLGAWREYRRREGGRRGVVFIGHSQGTAMLRRLLREEVDRRPSVRRRLVSAILLGGNVKVRRGSDRGGDFRAIRACRSVRQTGCVVAYSTFDRPPPPDTLFGKVGQGFDALFPGPGGRDLRVLCTNPASLDGGTGSLRPNVRGPGSPPWTTYPGLYRARCRSAGGTTWLQADVAEAADPRPRFAPVLGATWGLHLVDPDIALGNLTDLVRRQAAAYVRRPA